MMTKLEIDNCSTCILCHKNRLFGYNCNHPNNKGKNITATVYTKQLSSKCPLRIEDLILMTDRYI